MQPDNQGVLGLAPFAAAPSSAPLHAPGTRLAWLSVALALGIAGFNLSRQLLPVGLPEIVDAMLKPVFAGVQKLHSGLIGDYIAWVAVGLAMFTIAFAWSG